MSAPLEPSPAQPMVQIPVMVAAELQDSLLTVVHDLHRLEGILNHAADNLIARFGQANRILSDQTADASGELAVLRDNLRQAVTELQFHDLATQLIAHVGKVLQACSAQLAAETMGEEEGEEAAPGQDIAPARPNPVTQGEMDAGSIELF